MSFPIFCSAQEHLDTDNLDAICAFNYHMSMSTTREAFESSRYAYPTRIQHVLSLFQTQRRIANLSGLKEEYSDCCRNVCCCFTGSYKDLDRCSFCQEPRYNKAGNPQKRFQHLPIGPRLQAMFTNNDLIELMDYQTTRTTGKDPNSTSDVFDAKLYRELCEKFVWAGDQTFGHRYVKYSPVLLELTARRLITGTLRTSAILPSHSPLMGFLSSTRGTFLHGPSFC